MGTRFKRTRVARSEQVKETGAPLTQAAVISAAVPPFLENAAGAFDQAFCAIFEQAVFESERLGRTNTALRTLEDKLLAPKAIEELTDPEVMVELYKVLAMNSAQSTRLLLDISRTITGTRAVATIMANIKRMADAASGQQRPPIEARKVVA